MKIKFEGVDKTVVDLEKAVKSTYDKRVMDMLGLWAIKTIRERTQQGKSADLVNRFKGYSKKPIYISTKHRPSPSHGQKTCKHFTKKKRAGKTRFFPGGYRQYHAPLQGGSSKVTLTATHKMFNAMRHRVKGRTTVRLYFATKRANLLAAGHNEGNRNTPRRRFFGIAQNQKERKALQAYWARINNAK